MLHWVKQSVAGVVLSSSLLAGCSSYSVDLNSLDSHKSHHSTNAHHVGAISPNQLLSSFPVFKDNKESDPYQFDSVQVKQLAAELDGKQILVVFGTWCHDSQREVPRLLNLLQTFESLENRPDYHLEMVAINQAKDSSEYINKFGIKRVPTILVLDKDGNEVRRITERPRTSLATDLTISQLP